MTFTSPLALTKSITNGIDRTVIVEETRKERIPERRLEGVK